MGNLKEQNEVMICSRNEVKEMLEENWMMEHSEMQNPLNN